MNRFAGIAVVGLVVLLVLAGLYAGGYWLWIQPQEIEGGYILDETPAGRALGILYAPVFYCENAKVVYYKPPSAMPAP